MGSHTDRRLRRHHNGHVNTTLVIRDSAFYNEEQWGKHYTESTGHGH